MSLQTKSEKKREGDEKTFWAIFLIGILLVGGGIGIITYINLNIPQTIILESDGYRMSIDINIRPYNRWLVENRGESGFVDGSMYPASFLPQSSQLVQEYEYLEDFESATSWLGGQRRRDRAYQGNWAYREEATNLLNVSFTLNQNFTILDNETEDITFYTLINKELTTNGYSQFRFNVWWDDPISLIEYNKTIVYTFKNGSSFTPNPNYINLYGNSTTDVWCGHLINDIRSIIGDVNETAYYENLTIGNFELFGKNSIATRFYMDYFMLTKFPSEPDAMWFLGANHVSDYVVEVDYRIEINSTYFQNISEIILNIEIYRFANSLVDIPRGLIDYIVFSNFTFTAHPSSTIFDKEAVSSYIGVLHPFPPNNDTHGNTMDYEFDAYLEGWGELYDGTWAFDSATKDLNSEDFTIDWRNPLQVS